MQNSPLKEEIIQQFLNGKSNHFLSKYYKLDFSVIKKLTFPYQKEAEDLRVQRILTTFAQYRNIKDCRKILKLGFKIIKSVILTKYLQFQQTFIIEEEIHSLYQARKENNLNFYCQKYQISLSTAYMILKSYYKEDLKIRKRREIIVKNDIFKNIDTSEKAYFLGLILTDGCVHKKLFSILLQKEDGYLLQKLSNLVCGNDFTRSYKNYTILSMTNENLIQDLKSLGCVERKTYSLQFPKINGLLIWHFIRGLMDGDGSIIYSLRQNKYENWTFTLVGYIDLLIAVKAIIENLGINVRIRQCKNAAKGISTLSVKGNQQVKKLLDQIYQNKSDIFMIRKFEKYQKLKEKYGESIV